jgi:DNA-binding IclR family transcriptional regulator
MVSSEEDQGVPSNSLDRALLVLERIERCHGGLTNSQVSRALGIATSSCSYILTRLERRGYLQRDSRSGKYRIGLTTLALAHGALRDMEFRSIAEPILYRLVSETGLSASLAVVERGRVLFVDRLESPQFLKDAVEAGDATQGRKDRGRMAQPNQIRRRDLRDIGRELPVHSNAPGKMILAHMAQDQVHNIIQEHGLEKCTPRTIVSAAQLMSELELIRKRGWAVSHEEQYLGISAIAAPTFGYDGEISAAISLNGNSSDPIWQESNQIIRIATAAGREITNRVCLPSAGSTQLTQSTAELS